MTPKCTLCGDVGWVCDGCGSAGAPCPWCNVPGEGEAPRMPDGFKTEVDKDGWRH
jgi:hypothetical protein